MSRKVWLFALVCSAAAIVGVSTRRFLETCRFHQRPGFGFRGSEVIWSP